MKTNLNQSVEKAILNLSETVSDEETFLDSVVQKKMKKILTISVGNKILLHKEKLLQCDKWIQKRILRTAVAKISENNLFPDKETINRLLDSIISGKNSHSLKGKLEMKSFSDYIVLYPRKKLSFNEKLDVDQSCHLHKINYIITVRLKNKTTGSLKDNKNGMVGRFDLAKIKLPLSVRSIKDGDQFCPLGMRGSKK